MTSADNTRPSTGEPERAWAGRNRLAKVSAFFALGGVACIVNLAGPIGLLHPGIFVGMAVLCALAAIIAGHAGRFRGRRLDGEGRGLSLAGILTGWLLLLVSLLLTLAFIGLVAGMALLVDGA
ncbi:MAG: DUF4190 domain-containing protein [Streptomyces sp.]